MSDFQQTITSLNLLYTSLYRMELFQNAQGVKNVKTDVISLISRLEAAERERGELQDQLRALVAENVLIKSSVPNLKDIEFDNENMDDASLGEDIGFNQAVVLMKNRLSQTPATDAALRKIRAKELDVIADELSALDTVGSTGAIAYVIRQKAARIRAGEQP